MTLGGVTRVKAKAQRALTNAACGGFAEGGFR